MSVAVYSPARAKQLRILLWAAVVLAAAFIGLAVFVVTMDGSTRFALFLGSSSVLVLLTAMFSLQLLEERGRPAKVGAAATGGLLAVVGLLLANLALGILPTIVGVLLLLVALLRDHGEMED
jgi:ATP/ADP translocase